MKNFCRYCLKTTLILFGFLAFSLVNAQAPVATLEYNATGLVPGSTIQVPLKLTGTEVGNMQFLISYDRDVLTYVTYSHTFPGPGIANAVNNYTHASMPGQVFLKASVASFAGAPGFTYSNQALFTFTFVFNGGSTNFTFSNIASTTSNIGPEFTYIKANPYGTINLQSTFNNGSAAGAYATLTSVAGGGDWNTAATWQENAGGGTKTPNKAYNVIITGTEVTINPADNSARCHDLTVNSAGQLTLNAGKALTVNGAFTINSGGSFVDKNPAGSFTATVKRYITGNYPGSGSANAGTIWHYVSSPVAGSTIGTFMNCLMNQWTENSAGGIWDTLALPVTLPMEVGRGYSVAATPSFGDAVFSGMLNNGDLLVPGLTNSNPTPGTGNNFYGYHLIGNPYPSAFTWNSSVVRTNVDGAAYLWNGTTYVAKAPEDNYQIQSAQGFFVHASASGASLMIPNSNRIHSSGNYLKNSSSGRIDLVVNGNDLSDETSVRFNTDATNSFDSEYDAYKLLGVYYCPQIFSMLPDMNLAINSLPTPDDHPVVAIGFKTGVSGTYTINATGLETFNPGTEFYLTDLFTGNVQNLNSNPAYTFQAAPGSPEHRFNLHFGPVGLGESGEQAKVRIYSGESAIYAQVPEGNNGFISVFDLLGKEMYRQAAVPGTLNEITGLNLRGLYIVKFSGSNGSGAAEKVFIR